MQQDYPDTSTLPTAAIPDLSPRARSRHRRYLVITMTALSIIVILTCSTLGYTFLIPQTSSAPAQINSPTTNVPLPPTVTRLPSPGPMTMARWNALMGCAHGAPKSVPGFLASGTNPYRSGSPPPEVALTFDDGPTPYDSPRIISYLTQAHIPATFFVEGQYVLDYPYLLKREWSAGFAIGMHSWNHPDFTTLTVAKMQQQLGNTLAQLHHVLGARACLWFWRPPFGSVNRTVLGVASSFGLTTINWDDAGLDWTLPGPQQIAANVWKLLHPGAIILLHDGPQYRDQTLAALPLILNRLKDRGLTPVTIPQLLSDNGFV